MPNHNTITDPYLHEPKGIAAAATDLVYISNGTGSGAWKVPTHTLNSVIADVSTPSLVYVPTPLAGRVKKVVAVLHAPITLANSIINVKNAAGVSMGTFTVPFSGSAAGNTFVLTPVSNNLVNVNSFITIETDGGSTTTAIISFTVLIEGT